MLQFRGSSGAGENQPWQIQGFPRVEFGAVTGNSDPGCSCSVSHFPGIDRSCLLDLPWGMREEIPNPAAPPCPPRGQSGGIPSACCSFPRKGAPGLKGSTELIQTARITPPSVSSPRCEWGQGDLGGEGGRGGGQERSGEFSIPSQEPARAILHGAFPIQRR